MISLTFFLTVALFSVFPCTNCMIYNGTIAGNYSISQCLNGHRPIDSDSDMFITTSEMIRKMGYPAEEHVVETENGYLITMHRIPGSTGASPVFVQYGIICSSFDWIVNGKGKALAFLLADQGYYVWLGNARGNIYSQCHTKYGRSESRFQDFSWHEMGIFDIAAEIKYVRNVINQDIIYVDHSMGTTMFYILAIERPKIVSKVKAMFSLAPIAYIYHLRSIIKLLGPFGPGLELFSREIGTTEWMTPNLIFKFVMKYFCSSTLIQRKFCANFIFAISGFDAPLFNYTLLPIILHHMPAGTSLKTVIHFYHEIVYDRFQRYDYGSEKNFKTYNSTKPPEYNISKIQVPIGILWSDNDFFVHPRDVKKFYDQLRKKILNYRVKYSRFNHVDFMWGSDASKLVYSKLISAMENCR